MNLFKDEFDLAVEEWVVLSWSFWIFLLSMMIFVALAFRSSIDTYELLARMIARILRDRCCPPTHSVSVT